MPRLRSRLLAVVCCAGLAIPLAGCFDPSTVVIVSQDCTPGSYCALVVSGALGSWGQQQFQATVRTTGTGPEIDIPSPCAPLDPADSITISVSPSSKSGDVIHYVSTCGDPVLAEWPDAWFLANAWWSYTATGNDGPIGNQSLSAFQLPAGYGPVVTNPGYSAHVIQFSTTSMPSQSIFVNFQFRYNSLPLAYVKGLDVGVITILETGQKVVVPEKGASLDFTTLQPPDPRVLLLGPGAATASRKSTWGELKSIYR